MVKINDVSEAEGERSPSAARSLSAAERHDLSAVAKALPPGWVARVEPPYGQLAITPVSGSHWHHRCWVASPSGRVGQTDVRRVKGSGAVSMRRRSEPA